MTQAPVIAIETGGTKINCALVRGPGLITKRARFATTTPAQSLQRLTDYITARIADSAPAAIGIAAFGPVGLDRRRDDYGHILKTPKPGWSMTDLVGPIVRAAPGLPVGFDTDVNGAALGEARWGAGQGLGDLVYVTIGTGVGGGAIVNGRPVHGLLHPEMGHIRLAGDQADGFAGICPFHGDCVEGLVSGPAIEARTGLEGAAIADDHPVWGAVAETIGHLCATLALMLSPRRIILGGGVMARQSLYPPIRMACSAALAGYQASPPFDGDLADYITPPGLGGDAGLLGAACLAYDATSLFDQAQSAIGQP